MNLTAKHCFPNAKLVSEAFQHVRIENRWKAIEGKKYKSILLSNGDTKKKLLARNRYILSKKQMIGLKIKN